jgi:hypothetical protein
MQVNQARQSGFVYDYETLHSYSLGNNDQMDARMRVAAFLVPEAPGYFAALGKAVALYDYDLRLDRMKP